MERCSRREFLKFSAGVLAAGAGATVFSRPEDSQALEPENNPAVCPTNIPEWLKKYCSVTRTPTPTPTPTLVTVYSPETVSRSEVIYCGPSVPKVAITIDDGWWPNHIQTACDFSEKYQVPLSFFILGNLLTRKETNIAAKMAISLGCELQNHGCCNHPYMRELVKQGNLAEIRREIKTAQEQIFEMTGGEGASGQYFRPPFGSYDSNVVNIAHELGLEVVMWSRGSGGTGRKEDGQLIGVDEVLNNLKYTGQGDIVLLHTNWNDVGALERYYLEILQPAGLTPVLLSELTPSRFA